MNTKHISLAFAAATALLAGCAKSPIEEVKTSEQLTDLELAYVGAIETKAAIDGTTFPTEGEIGLFLFKDELAETPYGESGYTNVKYAYNSSKSKWTASPSIKVGSDPGYLFGYYPYDSEVANVKAIPVASSLNGDDVMYAAQQTITDATASHTTILMNHALARVTVTVKNNGYTGAAQLSKIMFGGAETSVAGTLDATSGALSSTTKADVELEVPETDQEITSEGSVYECLLVPSAVIADKQDVSVTFTIDGDDKTATLSGDNGVIIAQGTKSNITITLSNSGISVSSVSIDDWKEVEVGGHKLSVKFDEGVSGIEEDVWVMAYAKNGNAVIEAFSKSNRQITCQLDDDSMVNPEITDNISKFVIPVTSKDIIATIGVRGEGGRTGIVVGGYSINVIYDDIKDLEKNVLIAAYADGDVAKVEAFSKLDIALGCVITGDAKCDKAKKDNIYTFTISDVSSDITATIGYQHVTGINLNETAFELRIGARGRAKTLTATIEPEDAVNKKVIWSSNDDSIASVDDNGKVTSIAEGETVITATTEDGGFTAQCTVTVIYYPDELPGVFSVSAEKKVAFSTGNLYCTRTSPEKNDWTWHFYDKQYEFLTADMQETRESRDVSSGETEIHLFTWGYSPVTSLNPIGTDYVTAHPNNGEQLVYDKPSSEGGDDWGVAYCESNGADVGTWRTLTGAEWQYLFNHDGTTDPIPGIDYSNDIRKDKYKSGVIVCGSKECVVLLPDNWDENVISLETFATKTEYGKDTTPEWSAMEAAGAVCLPAAGLRSGSVAGYFGMQGGYWSSTAYGNSTTQSLQFGLENLFVGVPMDCYIGCSVRLVADLND